MAANIPEHKIERRIRGQARSYKNLSKPYIVGAALAANIPERKAYRRIHGQARPCKLCGRAGEQPEERKLSHKENSFDLVISGGTILDGRGGEAFKADVGVTGDRVSALGDLSAATANTRIDASEKIVAPGFIDAHTHDDRAVLSTPEMTPKVSQGVTTVITGNCGVSLAPLVDRDPPPPLNLLGDRSWFRYSSMREYVDQVRSEPAAVNMAMLAGHSTLRAGVMDSLDRPASAAEIDRMGERLDEALRAGCIGMSTGLAYPPAINAPTDEVVELAKRVAAHGGIYTTHMRDERGGVVDSVRESIEIGERANLPVVISHHKCSGRENWGLTRETLPLIAEARKRRAINLDVYPYTASSTTSSVGAFIAGG